MNSAAPHGSTGASTATAYSIGQQLIITSWDVLFAVILVSWVFGWSGGKALVESSYEDAKAKSRELKEKRRSSEAPVAREKGDGAHSAYNALIRRLVSFE